MKDTDIHIESFQIQVVLKYREYDGYTCIDSFQIQGALKYREYDGYRYIDSFWIQSVLNIDIMMDTDIYIYIFILDTGCP